MDAWPGGLPDAGHVRTVGSGDRWVTTPSLTVQRITGDGDVWWADGTASYPDGSTWYFAALLLIRDGRIHRERWIFGLPLEAPAWRSQWVETMTEEAG